MVIEIDGSKVYWSHGTETKRDETWMSAELDELVLAYENKESKTGVWIDNTGCGPKYLCSNCRSKFSVPYRYCPHCGVKMDEVE